MKKNIDQLLEEAEKEYKRLKSIKKKFPDARLDHLIDLCPILVAKSVNALADEYSIHDCRIAFYHEWQGNRIYADPIISRLYNNYHERDWLETAIEHKLPPQLLVQAIRETRSHYLSVKYYLDKYPLLRTWLAQY